jgi:hypothetical protein
MDSTPQLDPEKFVMSSSGKVHYKSRYKNALAWYHRNKERIEAEKKERYDTDDAYREHRTAIVRDSYRRHSQEYIERGSFKKDVKRVEKHLALAIASADKERERLKLPTISLGEHVCIDMENVT